MVYLRPKKVAQQSVIQKPKLQNPSVDRAIDDADGRERQNREPTGLVHRNDALLMYVTVI